MHSTRRYLLDRVHLRPCLLVSAMTLALDATALASPPAGRDLGPAAVRATVNVTSCADDGSSGTLRYQVAHAPDFSTVEMHSDELQCTITLETGEIVVPQNHIVIRNDGTSSQSIDARSLSRVFRHTGDGYMTVIGLDLNNGTAKYSTDGQLAAGGCIQSDSSVFVFYTVMNRCAAINVAGPAAGGAISAPNQIEVAGSTITASQAEGTRAIGGAVYAGLYLNINHSTVSGNQVVSDDSGAYAYARGGGAYSRNYLKVEYSLIQGNSAIANNGIAEGGGLVSNTEFECRYGVSIVGNVAASPGSNGGGFVAHGHSYVYYSLIAYNQAVNNSAGVFTGDGNLHGMAHLAESTISNNVATTGSSAIFTSTTLDVFNSTIAFNTAAGSSAGLYLYPGGDADIESTIISNNTSSSAATSYDLVARAAVVGDHDLIVNAAAALPPDTLRIDPELVPLQDNGGFTLTHALSPASAAIDAGSNPVPHRLDQRFAPDFPRVYGAAADIGAFELGSADGIFGNGFDP